ncbi:hypothetical protein [Sedimenticola selenatireducens]|uniref:hypothetical protein n=1 Tax=Sedimenticola selenatireducens TaxID=191960 RepID=UPI0023551735|nr:hypothetical protein [Sedimenticola selenatireducens]
MSLYTQIEKSFFYTLTRKIIGNVGFLLLFQLLTFWLAYSHITNTRSILQEGTTDAALADQLTTQLANHLMLMLGVTLLSVVAAIGIMLYMRHLFLHPIQGITDILSGITEKDGDI